MGRRTTLTLSRGVGCAQKVGLAVLWVVWGKLTSPRSLMQRPCHAPSRSVLARLPYAAFLPRSLVQRPCHAPSRSVFSTPCATLLFAALPCAASLPHTPLAMLPLQLSPFACMTRWGTGSGGAKSPWRLPERLYPASKPLKPAALVHLSRSLGDLVGGSLCCAPSCKGATLSMLPCAT